MKLRTCFLAVLALALFSTELAAQRFIETKPTLTELLAMDPGNKNTIWFVPGTSTLGDGGEGIYVYNPTATNAVGSDVFAPTGSFPGRWFKLDLPQFPISAAMIGSGTVSSTELGYIDGLTGPIMPLFDTKLSLVGGTISGDLTVVGRLTGTNVYLVVDELTIDTIIVGTADIPTLSTDQLTLGGTARTNWPTTTLSAPLLALESGIGTGLTNLLHSAVTNAIGSGIYQAYSAALTTLAGGNGTGLTSLLKAAVTNALGATGVSTQYLGGDGSFHDLPATGGADSYESMVITNLQVTSATVSNLNVSRINNALTIDGNLTVNGDLSVTGAVAYAEATITNLNVANATITNLNNGIPATIDVLVAGNTTNRLVFVGGVLVSNITTFSE